MLDLNEIIRRWTARGGVSAQCADELAAELRNAEPTGWDVRYTREDGEQVRQLYRHNPIGDFRLIDPKAKSEPFVAVRCDR